jgi:glycine dehydrogenase subunit 1
VPFSRLDAKAGLDDVLLVAATETTLDIDITFFSKLLAKVVAQ